MTFKRRFSPEMLRIGSKEIEFEDHSKVCVAPFAISRHHVTIAMMSAFCSESGHRTTSEQREEGRGFERNELVEHAPIERRPLESAYALSWIDADAFCKWAGVRLPTEAEWIAAAVADATIYPNRAACPFVVDGILRFDALGNCILGTGREWTSTRQGDFAVWRSGPRYFRVHGWEKRIGANRGAAYADSVELLNTFRFCDSDE